MSARRFRLVKEIKEHAEHIGANMVTVVLLLATLTDKGLTKFHKEFLQVKKYTKDEQANK